MANVIEGRYSLLDAIRMTYQYFENRFDYRDRDVIKRIVIKEIKTLHPDRPKEPTVRYKIETRSYPQYAPYLKKGQRLQRKVHHEYDTIIEMDKLSLQTKNWKARLGSGKKWDNHPPQSILHSIYKENLATWDKNRIKEHRAKKHPYLSVGDYNAKVLGINGDFIFKFAYTYHLFGHFYGRSYYGWEPARITNPNNLLGLPKHLLRILELLMSKGILKR